MGEMSEREEELSDWAKELLQSEVRHRRFMRIANGCAFCVFGINPWWNIGHIRGSVEPALVHVICVEDITETKQTDTDIRNFFGIRHVIRRATGERLGLVIVMCTAHRYYSIPLSFRVDTDFQCFKSVPTNTFDKRQLLEEFGNTAYQFLERVRRLRLKVPQVKGYNLLRIFGRTGYMYNNFVSGEVFFNVPPPNYDQR